MSWRPVRVDETVAFSWRPMLKDLERLVKDYRAVVVLLEKHELGYSLEEWRKRGVDVLHVPVPDFSAPSLEELLRILRWIEEKGREGKRVLVHCLGGRGRSGTVAVAWLMYSRGLSLREALMIVRRLRPGAVETEEQVRVLEQLEKFLSVQSS